ncbi:LytTR family DNA-binding domain-containing protein [Xanthobacter sp. ZOL 2024]
MGLLLGGHRNGIARFRQSPAATTTSASQLRQTIRQSTHTPMVKVLAMREFANLHTNPWRRHRLAEVSLAFALSPAFAWIGPFDVTEQVFLARVGYWTGMLASWFLMLALVERIADLRGVGRSLAPAPRWLALVGVAAVPMMLIVGPATHVLTGWWPHPHKILALYFQIVLIGAGASMIARAAFGLSFAATPMGEPRQAQHELRQSPELRQRPKPRPPSPSTAPPPPDTERPMPGDAEPSPLASALLARLPPATRGPMVAVEMEDHYARIHTDRGSALVLLRLTDAIAECAPTPGRQIHRSWWVADAAILGLERTGRAARVRLTNGLSAPVSQRYLRDVELFLAERDAAPL